MRDETRNDDVPLTDEERKKLSDEERKKTEEGRRREGEKQKKFDQCFETCILKNEGLSKALLIDLLIESGCIDASSRPSKESSSISTENLLREYCSCFCSMKQGEWPIDESAGVNSGEEKGGEPGANHPAPSKNAI